MSGSFRLQHPSGLTVTGGLTEAELGSALPAVAASRSDMRTGWIWYRLPHFSEGDVVVDLSLGFRGGRLEQVTVADAHPRFGLSWADWSEEKEHQRAASIGTWLANRGYAAGDYPWGNVWVGYDSKGGFGSASVRLAQLRAGDDPTSVPHEANS